MAKYEVICQARATIREVWHVEASGADEAREIMEDCPWRGGVGVEFVSQGVEGDEDERIIQAVLELPADFVSAPDCVRDAAPDLLAALIALRNECSGKLRPHMMQIIIPQADAAIAKATGAAAQ